MIPAINIAGRIFYLLLWWVATGLRRIIVFHLTSWALLNTEAIRESESPGSGDCALMRAASCPSLAFWTPEQHLAYVPRTSFSRVGRGKHMDVFCWQATSPCVTRRRGLCRFLGPHFVSLGPWHGQLTAGLKWISGVSADERNNRDIKSAFRIYWISRQQQASCAQCTLVCVWIWTKGPCK